MIVQLGGWSVHATPHFSIGSLTSNSSYPGAVRRMRTRIGLLAQPESYALNNWRHSVRAALRLSLKLSRE